MSYPSLLLFDLGGVLIQSAVFDSLNRLLPEPLDNAAIKERWLFSPAVRRFELGEISPEEFAESIIAEWGLRISPQAFLEEFITWPRDFFPGARETIRDLRKSYRVACLTNSNVLHWERFDGFQEDFDVRMSSHLLGAIKPDRDIFMLALDHCDVKPTEIYFFDDSPANVHSAQNLGITAFHVDGFQSLQNVLRVEGLLSN